MPPMISDRDRTNALARQAIDLAKALILSDNHFLSAAVGRLEMTPVEAGGSCDGNCSICEKGYASHEGGCGSDHAHVLAHAQAGTHAHAHAATHGHASGGPLGQAAFAVDGVRLHFDAQAVLRGYLSAKEAPKHDLLHAVMHCVFLHPYVGVAIKQPLWDLACDMASERAVMECCGIRPGQRGLSIQAVLHQVEAALGCRPTAEKIYHRLCEGRWESEVKRWSQLFFADCHDLWYISEGDEESSQDDGQGEIGQGSGAQSTGAAAEGATSEIKENPERSQGDTAGDGLMVYEINRIGAAFHSVSSAHLRKQQDEWRAVATSLAVNLQTFAKKKGQNLTGLVDDLKQAAHQRVDYAAFLRQFAIPGEVMKLSDEEFDYIFYTYGLHLYGTVPLIEPLEYREEKRIREFVIVIDTSGSVQGDVVRSFVTATFDILKSTESFHRRVQVHIIQSDAQVQSDEVITDGEELERWSQQAVIRGGGGTDFRPAFEYVDSLVEEGVFEDLGGLVYFTDGWGQYPAKMPRYRSAFVFYDEDYRPETVPAWAAQVVLDRDAIDTERRLHEYTGSN